MIAGSILSAMSLSGAIVDLDGTVYRGNQLIPGVDGAISRLRECGLSLLFFSNNPTKDGGTYVEHLSNLGLDVRSGEACSAGVVTTEYLQAHHATDDILFVGSDGLRRQLLAADLSLTTDPNAAEVVLASWTPEFHYDDMTTALHAIDETTTFLGTDPDRTFPGENGRLIPGSGAIVNSIAVTTDRDPDAILGKPSEIALETALDRLGVPAEECLVVGDRLSTDLAMGARAGMTTVLVLSGVTDRTDVAESDVQPEYVIDSLADIDSVLSALTE